MTWKIAEAKKHFSEMIHRTAEEPQFIHNRDTAVAVVIDPRQFNEYQHLKQQQSSATIGSAFRTLREICKEEDYTLPVHERRDRQTGWPQ
jgi:hypothetical protein